MPMEPIDFRTVHPMQDDYKRTPMQRAREAIFDLNRDYTLKSTRYLKLAFEPGGYWVYRRNEPIQEFDSWEAIERWANAGGLK